MEEHIKRMALDLEPIHLFGNFKYSGQWHAC